MKEMVPFFTKTQLIKTPSDADVCELYQAQSKREKMATQSSNPVVKGTWRRTVELEPLLSEAKARKIWCMQAQLDWD